MKRLLIIGLAIAALLMVYWVSRNPRAQIGPVLRVASASSFSPFLNSLQGEYQTQCNTQMRITSGSSGALATQILNGGPFDIFFSADEKRPQVLREKGLARTVKTYAYGRLVYWQIKAEQNGSMKPRILAMADPKLAPYGRASEQSLPLLRDGFDVPNKTVWGRSAAQVYQFVASGAAQAGLVPLSLMRMAKIGENAYFTVPENWHDPITQQLVVLHPSAASQCLLTLLQAPKTQALMVDAGFGAAP
jgi:molybdate transport system substrate-binding protein